MEFVYDLKINETSKTEVKEFFKELISTNIERHKEIEDAVFSDRLVLFFGDRDSTLIGIDEYGCNEYEDNARYSIHLQSAVNPDTNKLDFWFEILEYECENDFPAVETSSVSIGLDEEITDSILKKIADMYLETKQDLVKLSQQYMDAIIN